MYNKSKRSDWFSNPVWSHSAPPSAGSPDFAAWPPSSAWRRCSAVSAWTSAPGWPPSSRPCCTSWYCERFWIWAHPWSRSWSGKAAAVGHCAVPVRRGTWTDDRWQWASKICRAPSRRFFSNKIMPGWKYASSFRLGVTLPNDNPRDLIALLMRLSGASSGTWPDCRYLSDRSWQVKYDWSRQ